MIDELIQIGDIWFKAKKFNCGCYAVGINNFEANRYCPNHLNKALDEIIKSLDVKQT